MVESKHRWDFSKRINIDYPMCIDCHGNHDIGDPSDGYHMKDACGNCHDPLDKELPKYSQVIEQFDALWTTLSQVRQQRMNADEPVPPELAEDVAALTERHDADDARLTGSITRRSESTPTRRRASESGWRPDSIGKTSQQHRSAPSTEISEPRPSGSGLHSRSLTVAARMLPCMPRDGLCARATNGDR